MVERKCPACGENLEKNESVCPLCGLSGLDQVFLTKEAYELWKRDVLEKHLRGIVKKKIWYTRKESDEESTYGTLLFYKNNGRTIAVLRPKKEGNTYRINRLTRLGKIRSDHGYQMTITSDAGEFLIQKKWYGGEQELRAVRDLLKQLLPPFKGPANVWKDLDKRHLCRSDCLLVGIFGYCEEKGAVCTCDTVCTDAACSGDCDHGCKCDGYCYNCDCYSYDDLDCRLDC